jgi:hypothetical protein
MWVFKTDMDGTFQWEQIYDINTCDVTYGGSICCDGGYVITGMTSYGFGGDLWLAKLGDESTGIPINNDVKDVTQYVLYQNYPNPFKNVTTISFEIIETATLSVCIYDLLGKEVCFLFKDNQFQAGTHSVYFDASHLAGGMYYFGLESGAGYTQTKKMYILR